MTQLKMLTTDDKVAEIRRLYFNTSKASIEGDLAKALDLLKSMDSEDDRERATVFMEGLAEMRRDWERERAPKGKAPGARGAKKAGAKRPGAKSAASKAPARGGRPGAKAAAKPPRRER